jgi:hypothetical protein
MNGQLVAREDGNWWVCMNMDSEFKKAKRFPKLTSGYQSRSPHFMDHAGRS